MNFTQNYLHCLNEAKEYLSYHKLKYPLAYIY